jgi:peptide chain release factor 2
MNYKTSWQRSNRAWKKCEVIFDVATKSRELDELEARQGAPDFWDDQAAARKVIDEANAIRSIVQPFLGLAQGVEDARVMLELIELEDDEHQRERATKDLDEELTTLQKTHRKLEVASLLSGPLDRNNAYLSLHAGAGGTESCDWADMLYRMYRRYMEAHGFEVSVLDYQPGDEAGIKSVSFMVSGPFAFGYMKAERGVHRLVRISPFDSNKRRHTSFVSLDVVAEVDDSIEVEIEDKDLRVDTFRSSGAGGQHVNTTDSAIRITHQPTGIVVQCQAERSQHMNRQKAMLMLKARLYEWEQDQKRKEMERFYGPKGEMGWGHQIRSYVMQPYTMVKDHRTSAETGQVDAVLDGDLDMFIEAYLKKECGH